MKACVVQTNDRKQVRQGELRDVSIAISRIQIELIVARSRDCESKNRRMRKLTSSARYSAIQCPAPGICSNLAPGTISASFLAWTTGKCLSRSAHKNNDCVRMAG